jgi:hypothetical protein
MPRRTSRALPCQPSPVRQGGGRDGNEPRLALQRRGVEQAGCGARSAGPPLQRDEVGASSAMTATTRAGSKRPSVPTHLWTL